VIAAGELERDGFSACLDRALAIVTAGGGPFGVTLDLDAIDPQSAPGVGSPEPDGLSAEDVRTALSWIAGLPGFTALEIVEYNPDRDRFASTANLLAALLASVIEVAR
jgi:arginase